MAPTYNSWSINFLESYTSPYIIKIRVLLTFKRVTVKLEGLCFCKGADDVFKKKQIADK